MREALSLAMVVGTGIGLVVVMVRIPVEESEGDFTMQLLTDEPSFPALSLAVTLIVNVPEISVGIPSE